MESTSKTMSALRTKSNANNASEIPIGIVTEIGTQEISAKETVFFPNKGRDQVNW